MDRDSYNKVAYAQDLGTNIIKSVTLVIGSSKIAAKYENQGGQLIEVSDQATKVAETASK